MSIKIRPYNEITAVDAARIRLVKAALGLTGRAGSGADQNCPVGSLGWELVAAAGQAQGIDSRGDPRVSLPALISAPPNHLAARRSLPVAVL